MLSRDLAPAPRIAIVVLALAVFACLALPMTGGAAGPNLVLVCCFALGVLLSAFLLRRPHPVTQDLCALGLPERVGRGTSLFARPPDPVALGSLLI